MMTEYTITTPSVFISYFSFPSYFFIRLPLRHPHIHIHKFILLFRMNSISSCSSLPYDLFIVIKTRPLLWFHSTFDINNNTLLSIKKNKCQFTKLIKSKHAKRYFHFIYIYKYFYGIWLSNTRLNIASVSNFSMVFVHRKTRRMKDDEEEVAKNKPCKRQRLFGISFSRWVLDMPG